MAVDVPASKRKAAMAVIAATAIAARIPKPARSWRRQVVCSEARALRKRAVRSANSPVDMAMTPAATTKG